MSPQEFANKIREKYPNAYQDIDDITLSQKVIEKYPVYAPQVNFDITPETAEVKPAGFFERTVGAEVKETGERLAETFERAEGIPEKALAVGTVPLRAAGATARAGGRMIAEPISGLIKMASDVLSENKFVQDIAMGKFGENVLAGAEDIGSKISGGLEAIKEKVSPEVYQSLADTAELAMWAVGGKPAAEAGKVGLRAGVKAGVRAAEAGIRAGEVAVAGVKQLPKTIIEKSKQTVLNLGKRIYGAEGEKVIASLEKSYAEIPLPKNLLRSEAETGKSFSQFMAEKPYIPIKTKNMKYDTYATAQTLRQEVGAEAKALSSLLENRIERVSLDTIRQNVKNNVSKTTMGQERVSALSYVDNEFDLFVSQYKILDGTIDLTTANKIKQAMWDRSPFNPTASRMDRLSSDIDYKIGQAFKNNIEDAIPDVDIKALNSQLGDYYNAIQTLEKLHGGAAPRGRIGIEFARLAGAGIGSQGGFVGSIVGYMAAGKVAQLLASPEITTAFKRYIAQELRTARPKIADEVASILKKQSEEQISRLKLTEGAIPLGAKTGKSSVEAVPAEYAEIEKLLLGEGAVPLKAPVSESSVKAIQAEKGLVGQDPATGKFMKTFKSGIDEIPKKKVIEPTPTKSPLIAEARKYETADEMIRADFQKRVIAGQDLGKEIGKKVNPDGTITLYHGTSKQSASDILSSGKFNEGAYFSVKKGGVQYGDSPLDVAKRKFGKEGTVIEIKVDARDFESVANGVEVYSPYSLVKENGIWQSSNIKTKSQLKQIWEEAGGVDEMREGTITQQVKEDFEKAEAEVFTLLELSQAGERLFGEYGEFEKSVPSTFPDFISPELRSKKLFDNVLSKMEQGIELKGNKQIKLKNEIEQAIFNRMEPYLATEKQLTDLAEQIETKQEKETNLFLKEIEQGIIDKLTKKRFSLLQVGEIKAKAKAGKEAKIKQLKGEFEISKEKAVRKGQLKTLKTGITERLKGIARGLREGRVVTKTEILGIQNELLDMIDQSRLDLSDKAKFRRTIKNVQTAEQFQKALPKIQAKIEALTEKADKRTLKSQIKKELKNTKIRKQAGKPVGKFTPEVQKTLNLLRDASRLTKSAAEDIIFNKNLALFKDKIPTEEIALENKVLSMIAGMDEMNVSELQNVLTQIQTIKDTGKLTAELKKFNRQTDIDIWVEKAVGIITGGKGLPANISTIGTQEVRPELLKERVKKFMGTLGKDLVGWNDLIDMIARQTKEKTTWLDKFADVTEQENAVKKGHRTNLGGDGKARKITEEAFGLKKDREIVKLFKEDANEVLLGTFKNTQGEMTDIKMTKAEARKRWMELQDPTLRESFTEGMFYTDEIIKSIENFLTPQDKVFAQKQLDFYKNYYNSVNEIYSEIYGVDLPKNEFYSPIKREGIEREDSAGFGEFLQEVSIRKSVSSGSLKSRVKNIRPVKKQSDVATLEQHIAEMEHFKAWANKIRDFNAVFGNPQVRTAIIREHGKSMLGMIDNFIGDFTRGGIELASRLSWLDKLRGNFSRAILAIKPSIGVKQLTSFIAYADAIPVKDFSTGVANFWRHPVENIRILRQSEMMKARGEHMERDIKTAHKSDAYASFRKHPSFLNALMLNIQAGDQGAIYAGGWSVYKYYLPKIGHKEALKKFEQITSNTQQSADLSKQSYWQRGGSFAKLFTMFKSAPNQFFRKELGAVRNRIHGKISTPQLVKTIVIFHFLLPMFFQFVSDWFKWEPEEQKRAVILGPFNGIFIVGDMLDTMLRYALGMRVFDSELPIYSIADDFGKAIKLVADDDITTEDVFKAIRGIAGATGGLTGIPLKQPIDISMGVKDVLTGEYEQGLAKFLGWSPYIAEKQTKKASLDLDLNLDLNLDLSLDLDLEL